MNRAQEIAWAAGVLEGEGCFTRNLNYTRRDGSKRHVPVVRCKMTDGDVIRRLRGVLRAGSVYKSHPPSSRLLGYSPEYILVICTRQARETMKLILPYMGKRRSARIRQLLRGDVRTVAETKKARA